MDELRTLRPVPRWLFTGWYDVIMDPGSSKLLLWLLSFTRDRESSSSGDERERRGRVYFQFLSIKEKRKEEEIRSN